MSLLFAFTLFASSALLFLVQPIIGRLVLPRLGGTPAVWNTCMVFFQAMLLAGYAYAHAVPAWLGTRLHAVLHAVLLLVPCLVLPLGVPQGWSDPGHAPPVLWLLGLLFLSVGLPFFVLSTTAPLLQRWLAATRHRSAGDPYFLYVASNLGSLLALLSYPLLLEPLLPLSAQCRHWSIGYAIWVLFALACAAWLWKRAATDLTPEEQKVREGDGKPGPRRKLRWVLLAFVPSGLLLSVTTYLTTDIAAVPLLWVLPLALYLLTFILAFSQRPLLSPKVLSRGLPLVVLLLVIMQLSEATELVGLPVEVLLVLHLVGFFWLSLFCHTELARDRPAPAHLTEFYLLLSLGGVLGGLFTGLLAPLVFSSVVEYPLLLVLASLLRFTPADNQPGLWKQDVVLALGLGTLTSLLVIGLQMAGMEPGSLALGAMFGVPAVVCYTFLTRPLRFGLGIAALFLAGSLYGGVYGKTEARVRSFFGVHRVTIDPTGSFRLLIHGNTIHGQQSLDPERRRLPLTYYHPTGPAGHAFTALEGDERLKRVGLVGLGTGALSCYATAGQHWTYFEIDPAVIYLARDSGLFTFLRDCPAELDYVEGDARLTLARETERFGLLVIDAFSSDAIPVHLLTREALQVYRDRLVEDGLMLFNISNRYLDLRPVLAALAEDADLVCLFQEDPGVTSNEKREGKAASQWVVLAPSRAAARQLLQRGIWETLRPGPHDPVWSDDHSNLLRALRRE